jgi:hypothetical protein
MKRLTIVVEQIVICVAILLLVVGANAASTFRTRVKFSEPVRVPGATLAAGTTYFFQSPETKNRTLVRVTDENGKFVVQFKGIPERSPKRDHDIITFGAKGCKPTSIKIWFHPHADAGVRFVYPKDEAAEIAASCNEPVPETHESTTDASQLQGDKVYLVTPKGQEEQYKSEALSASDQLDQNGFDGQSDTPQR